MVSSAVMRNYLRSYQVAIGRTRDENKKTGRRITVKLSSNS
jgi:hypothetical protein